MFGFYLLDVHATSLRLNKEVYTDTGGAKLSASVRFLDLPATEIQERERRFIEDDDVYVYNFRAGQTYHFSMACEEMVRKMKRAKLKIGVFKPDDRFPVCHVFTHLSGCACDMASENVYGAIPFEFRGPFELVDPGLSFAGSIDIGITLINLGKSLVSRYGLAQNCCVFKEDDPGAEEYKCYGRGDEASGTLPSTLDQPSAAPLNEVRNEFLDNAPPGINLIETIAGLSPTGDRLALGSPPPMLPRPPLVDPTQSTRRRRRKGKKGGKKKKKKKK